MVQVQPEPFKDHLSTYGHLTGLRNTTGKACTLRHQCMHELLANQHIPLKVDKYA